MYGSSIGLLNTVPIVDVTVTSKVVPVSLSSSQITRGNRIDFVVLLRLIDVETTPVFLVEIKPHVY